MKIWLIEQECAGYGHVTCAVVIAATKESAKTIDPHYKTVPARRIEHDPSDCSDLSWPDKPEDVIVTCLGDAVGFDEEVCLCAETSNSVV